MFAGGMSLAWFIDLPSLLFFVITVVPVLIGSGLIKDFGLAFKIGFSREKNYSLVQLKNSVCAIKLVIKTLLVTSGFVTVISLVVILGRLDNLQKLGPNLAVCLLSFCYSLFFTLILLPLKAKIEKMINQKLSFSESDAK